MSCKRGACISWFCLVAPNVRESSRLKSFKLCFRGKQWNQHLGSFSSKRLQLVLLPTSTEQIRAHVRNSISRIVVAT